MRRIVFRAIGLVVIFANTTQSWADPISKEKYNQLQTQVKELMASQSEKGPIIVLPKGMLPLTGFNERKNPDGQFVITPGDDPQYAGCMKTAIANFGFDVSGGTGIDVIAMSTNGLASMGRFKIATDDCMAAYGTHLRDALGDAQLEGDVSDLRLQYGGIHKTLGEFGGRISDLNTAILGFELSLKSSLTKDLNNITKSIMTKEAVQKLLDERLSLIRNDFKNYFEEVKKNQNVQRSRQEASEKINLSQQALVAVIEIAFANDPVAVRNLSNAVQSFAKLANLGILMAAGSTTVVVLAALSAVGVINSLIQSFGKIGPSEEQIILEQIGQLREEVKTIGQFNQRSFSTLFSFLNEFSTYVTGRFDGFDEKLSSIIELIKLNSGSAWINQRLNNTALAYLVKSPLTIDADRCLVGASSMHLSIESYTSCLASFKRYATEVAKLDIVAGSGALGEDPLNDVTRRLYLTIDGGQNYSYLLSFYNSTAGNWNSKISPNPGEWAKGVDAYLNLLSRFDKIFSIHKKHVKEEIIKQDRPRIDDLIEAGKSIKRDIKILRSLGASNIVDLYGKEIDRLNKILISRVFVETSKVDLNVTTLDMARREYIEQVNNHSSVFRVCGVIDRSVKMSLGPNKDKSIKYETGTVCGPSVFTNKDNDMYLKQDVLASVKQWPDTRFAFTQNTTIENARMQLQAEYLDQEKSTNLSVIVFGTIRELLGSLIIKDAELIEISQRIVFLKHLLVEQLLLGYEAPPNEVYRSCIDDVQNLPGETISIAEYRRSVEIVRNDTNMRDALASSLSDADNKLLTKIRGSINEVPSSDLYPTVDRRMMVLRSLAE
ncbi:hypothetical protein [Methylobacterium sp. 17Sr1-1]|uniref:hypothetical protein n=1 Tax=Methylobacterium sp. 17Sr1-1 TaxID=2202826 RepID=UPI0013A5BA73|nr:hypothetical protein [Methylobacterium sp. 17Sr1-1]